MAGSTRNAGRSAAAARKERRPSPRHNRAAPSEPPGPPSTRDEGGAGSRRTVATGEPVGGELVFERAVFSEIAARVLNDITDVKQTAGDLMMGFLGRLLARGPARPGITVEDRGEKVSFHVEVVARHGVNFYELGLQIQRAVARRVRQMTSRPCVVDVNVRGVTL